jgi:hypothetical protein
VRFQTSETVSVQDPEMVLRALEMLLRDISSEVVRAGNEITLHGLGPSPRAMNYRDITVLVVSAEDDKTVIKADVTFQASAFLGDASQDAVVRSKLEQVFEQVKSQVDLEKRRSEATAAAPSEAADLSDVSQAIEAASLAAHAFAGAASEPVASDTSDAMAASPVAEASAVALLEEPEKSVESLEDTVAPVPSAEEELSEEESVADVTVLPDLDEEPQILNEEPQMSPEIELVHSRQMFADEAEEKSSRLVWLVPAIAAVLLLAAGAASPRFRGQAAGWYSKVIGLRHSNGAKTAVSPGVSETPVAGTNTATAGTNTAAAGTNTATTGTATATTVQPAAPVVAVVNSVDPKVWVESWAASMRGRDPVAQASFYADPVEHYIDQKNVSNATLVAEKRADIARRHGLWTFKLNDVVVESKTASEASLRLVKHYMVETEPSQMSELFVKTRLQLKAINGQWKIVSEREVHEPAAAHVDPIDQAPSANKVQ